MNDRVSQHRGHTLIALLALALLSPSATHAAVDLTGDWLVESGGEEIYGDGPVRIDQDGTSITFGLLQGRIDPETGEFQVVFADLPSSRCIQPLGIYARATDSDHFTGYIGGFWAPLDSPCHVAFIGSITGVRINPGGTPSPTPTLPPPTPTPTSLPCAGDCDGDGRVTVDEVVRLVRCVVYPCLDIPAASSNAECADGNGSGQIEVNELVTAVNNALRGCPI